MTKRCRIPTVEELANHAREIAKAFGVKLIETLACPRPEDAVSVEIKSITGESKARMAITQPITDETRYAVAMHEIGHRVHPAGSLSGDGKGNRNWKLKVMEEEAAWEWARHYSLDWTVAMEQCAAMALKSYHDEEKVMKAREELEKRKTDQDNAQIKRWARKLKL